MSEWTRDGRRWTFGAVTMVYDLDSDLPWSAWLGITPTPGCLSALAALDALEQCLVGERKHEAADEVRAARDAWIEPADRDAASAPPASAQHADHTDNRPHPEVAALRETVDELHRRLSLYEMHLDALTDCMKEWIHASDRHNREAMANEMLRRERIAKNGDR